MLLFDVFRRDFYDDHNLQVLKFAQKDFRSFARRRHVECMTPHATSPSPSNNKLLFPSCIFSFLQLQLFEEGEKKEYNEKIAV